VAGIKGQGGGEIYSTYTLCCYSIRYIYVFLNECFEILLMILKTTAIEIILILTRVVDPVPDPDWIRFQ
jgi:hypothetical protein